jgi:hypothetical protein
MKIQNPKKEGFSLKDKNFKICFNSSLRMCIDYRDLNCATVKIRYPMLWVYDLFDHMKGATIFSKIDL